MKRVGLGEGAIRQRMAMDGVAPDVMDAFFGLPPPSPPADPKPASASPEPPAPVAPTLSAIAPPPPRSAPSSAGAAGGNGASGASTGLTAGQQRIADKEAVKADPKFKKYTKMCSFGVPLGAVKMKMVQDELPEADITTFMTAYGAPPPAPAKPAPAAAAAPPPPVRSKEDIKNDPKYKKYAKMCAVGVPLGAVKAKMGTDGLTDADMSEFLAAYATPATMAALGIAPPTSRPPPGASAAARRRSKAPMLKLHWNPVPKERLERSVWGTPRDATGDLGQEELDELESMFAARPAGKSGAGAGGSKGKSAEPQQVTIVEFKRAYNVSIGLAQFKSFQSYPDLFKAILRLDVKALPSERLEQLTDLLPTEAELREVRRYKGDVAKLREAERWFVAVNSVPRLSAKLAAVVFVAQFPAQATEAQRRLDVSASACHEVINSKRLKAVLDAILAIGNVMNEGTYKGGAQGFTLDSLLTLSTTKGVDKKTTLMDYLAVMVEKKGGQALLNFKEDLPRIAEARRYLLSDVTSEVNKMKLAVTKLSAEAEAEVKDLDGNAAAVGVSEGKKKEESAKSGDARAALLSDMLAKRFGGGGGGSSSSSKSSSSAAGAGGGSDSGGDRSEAHPCSDSERRGFVRRLRQFSEAAGDSVGKLTASVDAMTKWADTLAQYFAEEPSTCPPERVFNVLHKFIQLFEKSKQAVGRRREAERRRRSSVSSKAK